MYHFIETYAHFDLKILFQLGLAAVFGLVIGFERELRKKPTGVKTLIVISVSSALLTIISIKMVQDYATIYHTVQDPLRLPANILTGIGFLGAGVIYLRSNEVVSGLTTASLIFGVSGLGIAIGAGFIPEAIMAALFFLIGVEVVPRILQKITGIELNEKVITIKLTINKETETNEVLKNVERQNIKINNLDIYEKKEFEGHKVIQISGFMDKKSPASIVFDELGKLEFVKEIEIRD